MGTKLTTTPPQNWAKSIFKDLETMEFDLLKLEWLYLLKHFAVDLPINTLKSHLENAAAISHSHPYIKPKSHVK